MKFTKWVMFAALLLSMFFLSEKSFSDQTFLVKLDGKKVGDEIFSYRTDKKDTNVVIFSSKTKISMEGMGVSIEQEEKLNKRNYAFSEYQLKADMAGQYQEMEAKVEGDSIKASAFINMQEYEKKVPYRESDVVLGLPTLSVYFYQILLNRYDFNKKGTQQFHAYLPDKLSEGPLKVTLKEKYPAKLKEEGFQVDHLEAVLVNLVINIWAKSDNHQLLKVDIPFMKFESSLPELSIIGKEEVKTPDIISANNFVEKEITFKSGEFEISGTLSLPKDIKGKFPAVILVQGSGPQDRDETVGPNKPFKDIAHALSNSGFAVLRYDKRTYTYKRPKLDLTNITLKEEVIDDAIWGIKFLREQAEVIPQKIFVLGHSLGAECTPLIALEDKNLAGVIMLAPSARPADSLILEQIEFQAKVAGPSASQEATKQLEELKKGFAQIRNKTFPENQMLFFTSGKYWYYWLSYSAADTIKKIDCPLLLLQGEKDCQVSMKDFEIWNGVLKGRGNSTLKSFANLNHLFMYVEGKSTGEEYQRAGHIDGEVLKALIEWIKKYSM
ncbi:MAG TPA: alpha/beta hydrolase [candidate division Zixibacteria bacterium]